MIRDQISGWSVAMATTEAKTKDERRQNKLYKKGWTGVYGDTYSRRGRMIRAPGMRRVSREFDCIL